MKSILYYIICVLFTDTNSITPEQINKAERIVNELIRDGKNVTVKVYTKDTPEEQLKEVIQNKLQWKKLNYSLYF